MIGQSAFHFARHLHVIYCSRVEIWLLCIWYDACVIYLEILGHWPCCSKWVNIIGLSTVHCGTWTIILWYLSHGNTESPVANPEISIKGGGNTAYEMGAARVMRQWLPNFFRQKGLGQRAPCPINPPLVPGGTPDVTGTDLEDIPCITTVCVLSDKKVWVQLNVFFSYTTVFKLVKLYICW